jgi:hypothetical protein
MLSLPFDISLTIGNLFARNESQNPCGAIEQIRNQRLSARSGWITVLSSPFGMAGPSSIRRLFSRPSRPRQKTIPTSMAITRLVAEPHQKQKPHPQMDRGCGLPCKQSLLKLRATLPEEDLPVLRRHHHRRQDRAASSRPASSCTRSAGRG